MPSDEKSHYIPADPSEDEAPPIPSYDEAIRGGSSSRTDWQQPSPSLDARSAHETEAQSLLNTSQPRQQTGGGGRRPPNGYRPPYVESDGEGSDWTLESDDDDDDGHDNEEVRREMQELEVEDPLMNGSTSSRSSSLWRKPISFSLPQWRWRWRLPRLTVRLPRANDTASNTNNNNVEDGNRAETGGEGRESRGRRWWQWRPAVWTNSSGDPVITTQISSSALLLLMGRLLALTLVLGFLWLLFMSDVFTSMSRRIGGQMFDPEQVRQHVVHMVDPAQMRATLRHYTSYAHVAGTEGDWALAHDVRATFLRDGLEDVVVDEYQVYLNYPRADGRAVEILSGDGDDQKAIWSAQLEEMDRGDEAAGRPTLAFHGHSKTGDVRGPLIYANYGSREDFRKLADMGIDGTGAIALVRYYGGDRDKSGDDAAHKVEAAELAGFAGCLIYTDPADDGFVRGDVAPNGRYMPADGVRRDSVSLGTWVMGDVLTPGWESKPGLPRMTLEQTKGLLGIPSLPLAARDAQVLLQHLRGFGEKVPSDSAWRGGVPDLGSDGDGGGWWTGNASGPVVRLRNDQDEEQLQTVWNVRGRVAGLEQAERTVYIGSHRDAFSLGGAADPGSGTAVMLEVARILGDLAARGWRPLRTVEFASWDASAYNLVGAAEFVEEHVDSLRDDAYAYINLGAAVSGTRLRARGSPVFRRVLARVLDRVLDPAPPQEQTEPGQEGSEGNASPLSLGVLWAQAGRDDNGDEATGSGALDGLCDVRGDYAPFQYLAGASSLDLKFVDDGDDDGASHDYDNDDGENFPAHSSYDSFDWMARVGDPDFSYHAALAQVVLLLVLELADRPVLPFDMGSYALELERYAAELEGWVENYQQKGNKEQSKSGSVFKSSSHDTAVEKEERREMDLGLDVDVDVDEKEQRGENDKILDVSKIRDATKLVESVAAEFDKWEQLWETSIIRSNGWEPSGLGKQRCQYNDRMALFETGLLDLEYLGGVSISLLLAW